MVTINLGSPWFSFNLSISFPVPPPNSYKAQMYTANRQVLCQRRLVKISCYSQLHRKMACSGVALLLQFAALLLSLLATMPTTAHSNYQTTDCRHYHPDMLGTVADGDEHRGCGQTSGRSTSGTWMTPSTPSTTTPSTSVISTTATTEPPVDVGALKSTISRQVTALYRAADDLLSSIVEDFDLEYPGKRTPCFYAERSKGNYPGNNLGERLGSDLITMEKYRDYFSRLQHLQMSQYEALLVGLRDLRENVGLLVNALNTSAVPAPGALRGGAQAFGDNCFNTSSNQQAVTLLNLQVFLKEHLLQDIRMLMDGSKAA